MGLVVKSWASCWLLLALFYDLGFGYDSSLVRRGRQVAWWRDHQRARSDQTSSRWGSRALSHPVLGFGAPRGGTSWGSFGGRAGGMLRQAPSQSSSPISVQCGEDVMVVSVQRDLYGTGKLVKPSDLTLGPQLCKPDAQSTEHTVTFQIHLQDCGNALQMNQDWMIYTTNLTYIPTSSIPIIRTNPAVVPIMCYYYRHANVSSNAIKPTWIPFSTTVSSEEKLSFSLHVMSDDWSGPRSSLIFQLGEVLSIEASVDTENHINLLLYVDRCVATMSPDISSTPSYDIITDNGCLVDGIEDDVSSSFVTPRVSSDKLRFTVDAFRFLGRDSSLIYITCYLRATAATQDPDYMNKACSYSQATQSWSAVEGPSSICQCCQMSGTCGSPTAPVMGGSRRFGRPRTHGKREALEKPHVEGTQVTTLGPLLVIGPKQSDVKASSMQESNPVELWVLAAVGCLSLLVVIGCSVLIGKSLRKPPYVLNVQS